MQRSQIDYLKNPGPTNQLIVDLVKAYQTGWTYSQGHADFSVKTQVDGGFVTDDPASGVFGKFDPARMKQIVDTFYPIFAQEGSVTGPPPAPPTLYTNDVIDKSIKMALRGDRRRRPHPRLRRAAAPRRGPGLDRLEAAA